MTAAAIQIQHTGLGLVRLREFTWLRLVLMAMVPQMFGSDTVFVLAIGGRCSPGELHRNHYQQKNGKPFAHEEHCSSFKFCLVQLLTTGQPKYIGATPLLCPSEITKGCFVPVFFSCWHNSKKRAPKGSELVCQTTAVNSSADVILGGFCIAPLERVGISPLSQLSPNELSLCTIHPWDAFCSSCWSCCYLCAVGARSAWSCR